MPDHAGWSTSNSVLWNTSNNVPGPVFSYKLRYIVGLWLVEMAISTNQKPTIYRNLYENTVPDWHESFLWQWPHLIYIMSVLNQTTVTAYFKSKQLLLFAFVPHYSLYHVACVHYFVDLETITTSKRSQLRLIWAPVQASLKPCYISVNMCAL